jgi:glycosyltransferase involved in cell wall biosynthesis
VVFGTEVRPMFSFLCTAYQAEDTLVETIESVLAQTRADWELIVVDNGMAEATAEIVCRYRNDDRIRLVRQENKGYAGGVTAAAAVAHGDWFCVLDSDDLVAPHFCETIARLVDAEPDVDAVGSDAEIFVHPDDGTPPSTYFRSIGFTGKPDPTTGLTLTQVLGGCVPFYTGAIRREAWVASGGYEQPGDIEQDVVLWLRLADNGYDVRLLGDRLSRYRIRADSISHVPHRIEAFSERLQNSFAVIARDSGNPENRRAAERTLRRLKYSVELRHARGALLDGDIPRARTAARGAFDQRRTVRAGFVVVLVTVAPRTLRAIHPAKQRVSSFAARAVWRFRRTKQ